MEPFSQPYYFGPEKISFRYEKVQPDCTFKNIQTQMEEPYPGAVKSL